MVGVVAIISEPAQESALGVDKKDSFDRINQTCRLFSSSLLDHDTKLPQDVLERVWSLQYQVSMLNII